MRTTRRITTLFAAASAVLVLAAPAAGAKQAPAGAGLAAARAATAAFHDVEVARAAGYDFSFAESGEEECVEVDGLGVMGYHVPNFANFFDGVTDATRPELLLYVPRADGSLRLVGAEYIAFGPDVPSLFGQQFEYEPEFEMSALHVWLWQGNPLGTFAPFNPAASC